jgi:hypothetical protein
MSMPSFLASDTGHVSALCFLQQPGYAYLSPEEESVERRGKRHHVLLERMRFIQ